MHGARTTGLSGKHAVGPRRERLTSRQGELVRHGRGGSAVVLDDLTSDRVVLARERDTGGALNRDSDAERRDARRVGDPDLLLVEPRAAGRERGRHRDTAVTGPGR